jgi:hypothetical protein
MRKITGTRFQNFKSISDLTLEWSFEEDLYISKEMDLGSFNAEIWCDSGDQPVYRVEYYMKLTVECTTN